MTETQGTATNADLNARFAALATKRYEDKIDELARSLHDLARTIQREGKPRPTRGTGDDQDDYLRAAHQVIHALHWGVANLNAARFLDVAAEAHAAIRATESDTEETQP